MILVDADLLLHAYNPRSADHDRSRAWLETTLSGTSLVRFAWVTLWAFIRIGTSPRVFRAAPHRERSGRLHLAVARAAVRRRAQPGDRHWGILQRLLAEGQAAGPLAMDAALAAIAIEHGATLCTTDRDFSRFPGLRWRNPLLTEP